MQKYREWTGPTCDLTPELIETFRKSCEHIVARDGVCGDIDCEDCPGCSKYNGKDPCNHNMFTRMAGSDLLTTGVAGSDLFTTRVASANRFLAEHPAPVEQKPKMVRVEFEKNSKHMWIFFASRIAYVHTDAPSILGAGGYEYEGHPGLRTQPMLFLEGGTLWSRIEMDQVESGEAVPVLPIAYWYLASDGDHG